MRWKAPATPGGVEFDVTSVSANRDGGSRGDAEGFARFNLSYGCEGVDAFLDQDGDGWGIPDRAVASVFARCRHVFAEAGRLQRLRQERQPEGREICNLYDDDCDGRSTRGWTPKWFTGHGPATATAPGSARRRWAAPGRLRLLLHPRRLRRHQQGRSPRRWRSATAGTTTATTASTRGPGPPAGSAGAGGWRPAARPTPACRAAPGRDLQRLRRRLRRRDRQRPEPLRERDVCHKGLCLTQEEAAEAAARDPPPPPPDGGARRAAAVFGGSSQGGSTGSGGSTRQCGGRRRAAVAAGRNRRGARTPSRAWAAVTVWRSARERFRICLWGCCWWPCFGGPRRIRAWRNKTISCPR